MTAYLTDLQKDVLGNQFFNVHDTFARPITAMKNAQQVVLSSNSANNYFFETTPFNDKVQSVLVSGIFMARITYPAKEDLDFFTPGPGAGADQINILKEDGVVRIRVDVTGKNYLYDVDRVTFDNEIFYVTSSKRPHGLFAPKFYDFILTKLE